MENIKAGDAVKVNLPDWFYFGQVVRVNSKTITVKSYDYKGEATGPARRIPTYMVKRCWPTSTIPCRRHAEIIAVRSGTKSPFTC